MASVRFYHKRTIKRSNAVPIFVLFTIDRNNRFALSTGEEIEPEHWDNARQGAKSKHPYHVGFNQSLSRIKDSLIQLYRDNKTKSVAELKEMAVPLIKFGKTGVTEKKTLFVLLSLSPEGTKKEDRNSYIDQCSREKDIKTTARFKTLDSKLKAFNPNLTLLDMDMNFYDRFRAWLFDKGYLDSTVYKYLASLFTFLAWVESRGHEVHRTNGRATYTTWQIVHRKRHEPITVTLAELEKMESLQITSQLIEEKLPLQKHGTRKDLITSLETARAYFVIECRTGQRISDVKSFNLKDMEGMVWVNRVIKGERTLGKVIRIPFNNTFTQPAYDILASYNFKLPEIAEQTLNDHIKTLFMLAGVDKLITRIRWKQNTKIEVTGPKHQFLSTHSARKSFITIALQYMQPKRVKDIAGISWATLKHYEGQSEDEVLNEGLNSIPVKTQLMKAI